MNSDLRPQGGLWSWRQSSGSVELCFAGQAVDGRRHGREEILRRLLPEGIAAAWLQQAHSASVVEAQPGDNGPGDGLMSTEAGLGLAVVTADCVPVLLSTASAIAAVHAGWRGLAARIVPAAADRLGRGRSTATAWIGPAIGPCCYEVGADVAAAVSGASTAEVVRDGPRGRPHLDLVAAARFQLRQAGIEDVREVEACTRCDRRWWSYRRDGSDSGRNVAVIWRAGS